MLLYYYILFIKTVLITILILVTTISLRNVFSRRKHTLIYGYLFGGHLAIIQYKVIGSASVSNNFAKEAVDFVLSWTGVFRI